MANKHYKDIAIKIDNASGTLTAITNWLNSNSIAGVVNMFSDDAYGVDEPTYAPGTASGTAALSGFVNSTTDGIFGPLIGQRTSVSKTFETYNGVKYYYGEVFLSNVQYSGAVNSFQTFSADIQAVQGWNRTSTGQA